MKSKKKSKPRTAKKKPAKKSAPKREPPSVLRALAPRDVRRIEAALRKLDQAQQVAAARGADLLAIAVELGNAAVEKKLQALASQLADCELLRDTLELKDAFAAVPRDDLPPAIRRLSLFPDAMLQWFADSFGLTPYPGWREREIPAGKLVQFLCDSPLPDDANQLVRIRVTQPGWQRNGKTILPARVSRCPD